MINSSLLSHTGNDVGDIGAFALLELLKYNCTINQNCIDIKVYDFVGWGQCSTQLQKEIHEQIMANISFCNRDGKNIFKCHYKWISRMIEFYLCTTTSTCNIPTDVVNFMLQFLFSASVLNFRKL